MSAETFRCITCDKSMDTRKAFNRHLNTHSKPHRCKSCLSGFALASDLVRHVKALHRVGNVQYRCHIESCTFTSNRKDNLKKHNKKYHKGALLTAKGDDAMANNTTTSSLEQLGSPNAATDDSNSLYGISILMQAATSGDLTTLELLLDAGVLLKTRADDQSTALHCAARAGQSKAVQYLLDKGADMNVNNTKRRLPVHEALLSSDLETVKIFLRQTTKQQLLDATQKFRYYLGRSNRVETLELYSELLGADFTANDRTSIFRYAVCAGSERIVAALKDHPDIDLNQRNSGGAAPIHQAARSGGTRVMELLLASERVDKDALTGSSNMRAIHLAAYYGQADTLRLLIEQCSSDIYCRDDDGKTSLQYAALNEHWKTVHIILEHFLAISNKCSTAFSTMQSAYVKMDVVKRLLDHAEFEDPNQGRLGWPRKNLLHRASEKGDCELMEILLAHNKVNVNAKDLDQHSALMRAARNGHFEAVRLLLQRSDIDMNQKSWRGTALRMARGRGHQEIVDLLLSHSAIDDGTSEPSIATRTDNASAADDSSDTQNIALPLEYEPDSNFDLDGFMNGVPDWDDFQEVEDGMFE